MQTGIYLILNVILNKGYVGASADVYDRWNSHQWKLRNEKHENPFLQADWLKFGPGNFSFTVLELLPSSTSLPDRAERERHHMNMKLRELGELYNILAIRPAPAHPAPDPSWLSVPIVADQMKVTEKTVHNWIDTGKLQAREEYHGQQRRRYVAYRALEAFKATLPQPPAAIEQ